MTKRALQLSCGIFFLFFLTLGFAGTANAKNFKIAFTVFVEGDTTPITGGNEYSTIKLRMTEKDVLAWLNHEGIYAVPDGAYLFYNGNGGILGIYGADGVAVTAVNTAYIAFGGSSSAINQGIWGFILGNKNKLTSRREEYFDLDFNAENFWNLTDSPKTNRPRAADSSTTTTRRP